MPRRAFSANRNRPIRIVKRSPIQKKKKTEKKRQNVRVCSLPLPNEILVNIFHFLPYDDVILSVPLVCRQFSGVIRSNRKYMQRPKFDELRLTPNWRFQFRSGSSGNYQSMVIDFTISGWKCKFYPDCPLNTVMALVNKLLEQNGCPVVCVDDFCAFNNIVELIDTSREIKIENTQINNIETITNLIQEWESGNRTIRKLSAHSSTGKGRNQIRELIVFFTHRCNFILIRETDTEIRVRLTRKIDHILLDFEYFANTEGKILCMQEWQ